MNTLKKALEKRGLTAASASRLGGLNYNTLYCQVTGKRGVGPDTAMRYEKYLRIPRSETRPDLWPPEQDGDAQEQTVQAEE